MQSGRPELKTGKVKRSWSCKDFLKALGTFKIKRKWKTTYIKIYYKEICK